MVKKLNNKIYINFNLAYKDKELIKLEKFNIKIVNIDKFGLVDVQ
jgi:hypothetical protein